MRQSQVSNIAVCRRPLAELWVVWEVRSMADLQVWVQKRPQLALLAVRLPCWEWRSIFTVKWERRSFL